MSLLVSFGMDRPIHEVRFGAERVRGLRLWRVALRYTVPALLLAMLATSLTPWLAELV